MPTPEHPKRTLLVLGALLLAAYILWTFNHSLWNPDETRDAGIARAMYLTKDFSVPRLNGEAFLEKPPLYYWSCSLIYRLFGGRVTAGLTRLPAALFGLLGAFFTFLIGKRLYSERTGWMAALMLATSLQYFKMSHFALMDTSLAALITGALYFYLVHSSSLFLVFAVLAFYSKGAVALALIGAVVGFDLVVGRHWKMLIGLILTGAFLLFLTVLPWAWGLWKAGGINYLQTFFVDNNWNRFFADKVDHASPFYTYLATFPVDFLPWTIPFVGALIYFFRLKGYRDPSQRFLWIWFGLMFLFLSVSSSKRSIYLLPAFPAAALLSAAWLESLPSEKAFRYFARTTFALLLILLITGTVFVGKLEKERSFLPVVKAVKTEREGADLVAFDMSEMERGVFPFYLEEDIPNFTVEQDLADYLKAHRNKPVVLLANKNKRERLDPIVGQELQVVYEFRPQKKTRSYVIYKTKSARL